MILGKEQINRYLRQIIIPEISEPGQKKLLDASVLIQSESVESSVVLLYYLAAVGIGHINCIFDDNCGYETLFKDINDLNRDVLIERVPQQETTALGAGLRVILGNPEYLIFHLKSISADHLPIIAAAYQGWKGFLQVLKQQDKRVRAASILQNNWLNSTKQIADELTGSIFSKCLLGALLSIEVTKLILDIGTLEERPLSFDLLSMHFNKDDDYDLIDKLFSDEHYDQAASDTTKAFSENAKKLSECKVLIVGTGGLGSPAAYSLVRAGIGTLGLMDYDTVDISNLNRQIIHSSSRIGLPKVDSAEIFLRKLNPDVKMEKYNVGLNKDNAIKIMTDYDLIIDCVDNFASRYLLNDACYLAKKPMVEAGVLRFDGLAITITPEKSACFRCLFPNIPDSGSTLSCSESGVLGPVPGVMGFIEASESVKLLTQQGTILTDSLMVYHALDQNFQVYKLNKNSACSLCGEKPSIKQLQEYEFACESLTG